MSEVMKHKGKKGLFLAQTVKNITSKVQNAMNVIAGIDSSWSVAKKTLAILNRRVFKRIYPKYVNFYYTPRLAELLFHGVLTLYLPHCCTFWIYFNFVLSLTV